MPNYLSPTGSPCTADEAMTAGRLRPGYKEILAPGESLRFDLSFVDSAPSSSHGVFLKDDGSEDTIRAEVDRELAAHVTKFAFLGDAAPPFDRERAEFLARQRRVAARSAAIRDSIMTGIPEARKPSASGNTAKVGNGQQVRDYVRDMRYGG